MKWTQVDSRYFMEGARQLGKSAIFTDLLLAWLDWRERGSPPDEEVPELEAVKIPV